MDRITAKTGNAQIEKLGFTAQNRFGRDSNARVKGDSAVRDQKVK